MTKTVLTLTLRESAVILRKVNFDKMNLEGMVKIKSESTVGNTGY